MHQHKACTPTGTPGVAVKAKSPLFSPGSQQETHTECWEVGKLVPGPSSATSAPFGPGAGPCLLWPPLSPAAKGTLTTERAWAKRTHLRAFLHLGYEAVLPKAPGGSQPSPQTGHWPQGGPFSSVGERARRQQPGSGGGAVRVRGTGVDSQPLVWLRRGCLGNPAGA